MYKLSKTLFIIITLLFLILAACAPKSNIPTFTSTPGIGSTWTRPVDNMVMVYVPTGNFSMGDTSQQALTECQQPYNGDTCQASMFTNEQPVHTLYLDAYLFDKTDVTGAMYEKCVNAGICKKPDSASYGDPKRDNHPVDWANWYDAQKYCQWVGARLPTEAEWEKAARGTDGRTFPWGNNPPTCKLANTNLAQDNGKNCVGDTSPVDAFSAGASPYGALDMVGNVMNWVSDWYSAIYYATSPSSNPTGPTSGTFRVVRGSEFGGNLVGYRVTVRSSNNPDEFSSLANGMSFTIGFRCARSIP
jgi:formylglycine-generating enzyme required for sulfatase activity